MSNKRLKIKMCGMTRQEDILKAASLGVDAIGLIFYPNSKRYISLEKAQEILMASPLFVDVVAVFVNPTYLDVKAVLDTLPIQWLQFHGDEAPHFCQQFHLPYIKAVPALNTGQIEQAFAVYHHADAILLDTAVENYGGSGKVFDWAMVPEKRPMPLILAGGLQPDNICGAVSACSPDAVDVCTGIESQPGIKDHAKMTSFIDVLGEFR